MTDLSQDARLLLELVRDAHGPGDDDRARVRAQLAARIGAAAGLGVAAGLGAGLKTTVTVVAGAETTAGAIGAGTVTAKLIGAALIVSSTVGAGAVAVHRAARRPPAHVATVPKPAPATPHPRAAVVTPPPSLPAPAPEPAMPPAPPPKHVVTRAIPQPVTQEPAEAAAPPTAAAPRPAVDEEVRLVHEGLVARRAGRAADALELFDRHARLYPHGVLAEERDAERALALADLGRVAEARAAIEAFLRAHPDSPLAARLRDRARRLD
jgi:tetratricopeptide (TPR) repeat protein